MTIPMFLRLPLAMVLFVLFIVVAWSGFCVLIKWSVAWKLLAKTFPVTDVHKLGKTYSGQYGYYYRKGSRASLSYMFRVEVAQEGLLVTGYFARRLPILIPWSKIQNIEEMNVLGLSSITISVDYEGDRHIRFDVPKEALTIVRDNVPAERLHKTDSLSQVIKNRLNQDHDA